MRGLQSYMNWLTLDGLDEPVAGWLHAIKAADYAGVQFLEPLEPALVAEARTLGLLVCGSGRVNQPEDADRLAAEARVHDLECLTLHVGWGMESEAHGLRLIDAVLEASKREGVPMHVETHRATLFQDIWRTVEFTRQRPELTFNADLSHWYTGLEFVYGGLEAKLDFIAPVLERVEFMHGRIGTPGCMQVDLGSRPGADALPYVAHFRQMWSRAFSAFVARHGAEAPFPFATELLSADIYYARRFAGREESDRWEQSAILVALARDWFDQAAVRVGELAKA